MQSKNCRIDYSFQCKALLAGAGGARHRAGQADFTKTWLPRQQLDHFGGIVTQALHAQFRALDLYPLHCRVVRQHPGQRGHYSNMVNLLLLASEEFGHTFSFGHQSLPLANHFRGGPGQLGKLITSIDGTQPQLRRGSDGQSDSQNQRPEQASHQPASLLCLKLQPALLTKAGQHDRVCPGVDPDLRYRALRQVGVMLLQLLCNQTAGSDYHIHLLCSRQLRARAHDMSPKCLIFPEWRHGLHIQ
ncbi:MAG: hypothetical protein BGO79_08510 [Delftia sp. 67-8]|nr:MAG: hypothetical protein BGO79_08510 [Delftia sp. 67-8]